MCENLHSLNTPPFKSCIGVFDSGLGGLSVLKALRSKMPEENLLYFGDCAYAPYGDREPAYIIERSLHIAKLLESFGAKALVVACNTATAEAVEALRKNSSIPVIGIEPAVKPAVSATKTGAVGVLATTRTITSKKYRKLVNTFSKDSVRVISIPCPGLMECVENGEENAPETRMLLERYLKPLLSEGCDQIVLGCTHYPFLSEQIRVLIPSDCTLIDPSPAVARETMHRLKEISALKKEGAGREIFFISGAPSEHRKTIEHLWGAPVELFSAD